MFGFKIIGKREYRELLKSVELFYNENHALREELAKERAKNKAAVPVKEGKVVTMANLNGLHVLKGNKYPCDKCELENPNCFKLQFADRTICVTDKQNVNSFVSKKKTTKTDKS